MLGGGGQVGSRAHRKKNRRVHHRWEVSAQKGSIRDVVHSSVNILSDCARTQTKERRLMEGHIKWYDEKKRFGFVTTQENEDIFLHVSGIKEYGHFGLQRDDRVEFEIRETAKGKQAVNLRPIK